MSEGNETVAAADHDLALWELSIASAILMLIINVCEGDTTVPRAVADAANGALRFIQDARHHV